MPLAYYHVDRPTRLARTIGPTPGQRNISAISITTARLHVLPRSVAWQASGLAPATVAAESTTCGTPLLRAGSRTLRSRGPCRAAHVDEPAGLL